MSNKKEIWVSDVLLPLRSLTAARIMLGRTGVSLPLEQMQALKLAHARARDAIWATWNSEALGEQLSKLIPVCHLSSRVTDRQNYLLHPEAGRQLIDESKELLASIAGTSDICIVVGDGLSPNAVDKYVLPFLEQLIPLLKKKGFNFSPICIVKQARIAIADEIGYILGAKSTIMLIGERPGLSASDSMGLYYTYGPKTGLTNAQKNCISNIREGGLDLGEAVAKTCSMILESFRLGLSGVELKDKSDPFSLL